LAPSLVATLTMGLRENSRVMMKIGKQKLNYQEKMLALIFDALQIIAFKQGHKKSASKPVSLLEKLTEEKKPKDELMVFNSADSFEAWRAKKMKGNNNG
jgi:hypothetical protein